MTAISMVGYMHRLKQVGFTDQQSEVQASQLEQVMASVKQEVQQEVQASDLTMKQDVKELRKDLDAFRLETRDNISDLKLEIEKLRYQTLRFCVWTGVAVVVTLSGMLAKGFHWF